MCTQNSDCQSGLCKMGTCVKFPLVGTLGQVRFFKVPVMGAMSDSNVLAACKAAAMNVGCQSSQVFCPYTDNICVQTLENQCGAPMMALAQVLCGPQRVTPASCPALWGLFQYMGQKYNNGSSAGAEQNRWPVLGNQQMNRFALCVGM